MSENDNNNPESPEPKTEPPASDAPSAAGRTGFDPNKTLQWVTRVLKDPNAAATAYRDARATSLQSFLEIVLPVYVAAYLVGFIVSWITGGTFLYAGMGIGAFLISLIWALAWTWVIAFIFDVLAGVFDGERNFDAAYALVALTIVPAALGSAVAPVPWIGWLIGLAASIYSLVLAYQFLPIFLNIPEASRVKHFAVSIIAAIVVNILVSGLIGTMFAPAMLSNMTSDTSTYDDGEVGTSGTGIFGSLERQASVSEAAAADTYDPPRDGRVSDEQMEAYVDVLKKTRALNERLSSKLEGMDEKDPSINDVFSGIGGVMRLGTAEMEVVKTRGGNWAEHQWVRGQIETARIQQDLNATTKHNFELFQEYAAQIEEYE